MVRRLGAIAIGLGAVLALAPRASASAPPPGPIARLRARTPLEVRADRLRYERARGLYVAEGHVVLQQGERTLKADWVSFSERTRVGVASGDVVVREKGDVLRAELIAFDVDTLRGIVFSGRLEARQSRFRLEGDQIRKTGPATYRFRRGRFTTCRCPKPGRDPWSIRAEKAEIKVGGYGTARNTTFDVLGVPVLWLPWMLYPLKTERQTGFLFPDFGASERSGGGIGFPFFWAAADNVNVLLTPAYLSKRGVKPSLEVEYLFGRTSGGRLFASYLRDRDVDPNDPATPIDRGRWSLVARHDEELPAGWRFKVNANLVSDNDYPFDFPEAGAHRADRFLESTAFVSGHPLGWGRLGLATAVRFADDLQGPEDLDRDALLLQRAPELRASLLPGPLPGLPGLLANLDLRYAYFRSLRRAGEKLPSAIRVGGLFLDTGIDGIPDSKERTPSGRHAPDASRDNAPFGPEADGRFEEGEPLVDRGHRLLIAPRLAYPLRIAGRFDLEPEIGYHGTLYQTEEHGFDERSLLTGRIELRTRLRRRFELPFGGGKAVHWLEPRLAWAWVSPSAPTRPLFVPGTALAQERLREADLANVLVDPADRIAHFNGLVLGLDNRILGYDRETGRERVWGEFSLTSEYRFDSSRFGPVVLEGRLRPGRGTRARLIVAYDPEATRLSEGLLQLTAADRRGDRLALGYRYLREIPLFFEAFRFRRDRFRKFEESFSRVNQIAAGARLVLTRSWALSYQGAYSFESSLVLTNRGGIEYLSRCRCWAAGIQVEDDRTRGVRVRLTYRLVGLGDDRTKGRRAGGQVGGGRFLDVLGGF